MPETVLCTWNTTETKRDKNSHPMELTSGEVWETIEVCYQVARH